MPGLFFKGQRKPISGIGIDPNFQQQKIPEDKATLDAPSRLPALLSPSGIKHKSCRPSSQSLLNLHSAAPPQCTTSPGGDGDHDLAALVHEFIENGSDPGDSEADTPASSLSRLCDSLKALGCSKSPLESELLSKVTSLLLSVGEESLDHPSSDCKGACLRLLLVRHLKSLGYDAAICKLKWQFCGTVPGGDYEYVDVVFESGAEQRLILDLDFQSQFEIARPTQSYRAALRLLPAVYVGSVARLHRILEIMSEAAKQSLQQSSLHLPPWRTIEYMFAKWLSSPHERSSSKVAPIPHPGICSNKINNTPSGDDFSLGVGVGVGAPPGPGNPSSAITSDRSISRQLRLCCGAESVKPCWEQLRRIREALRSASPEEISPNPSSIPPGNSSGVHQQQVKRGLGICLPRRRSSSKW